MSLPTDSDFEAVLNSLPSRDGVDLAGSTLSTLKVIKKVQSLPNSMDLFDKLRVNDLKGPRLWILYSYKCREDVELFAKAVLAMKKNVVDK